MTSIVELPIGNYTLEPANILQYDTISSRYYLNHSINRNLMAFGNNLILDGFETTYTNIGDDYTFNITPGKAICDLTLIESQENEELNLNISSFDRTGSIIIVINYKYSAETYSNAKLKIYYLDDDLITTYPDTFDVEYDNIVISHFQITEYSIVKTSDYLVTQQPITIKNKEYRVFPISDILSFQLKYIEKMELLYNYTQ
jgi:hypothetical protein